MTQENRAIIVASFLTMVAIGMNPMELNGYILSVLRAPDKHRQVLLQGIKQVSYFDTDLQES